MPQQRFSSLGRQAVLLSIMIAACLPEVPALPSWPDQDVQIYLDSDLDVEGCGDRGAVITPNGIGGISAGNTAAQLTEDCPHRLGWDWGDEGIPQPAIAARVGNALVIATVADTFPWSDIISVAVADTAARTPEGLGPGSQLESLIQAYGAPTLLEGECVIDAVFPNSVNLVWRLKVGVNDCAEIQSIARANNVNTIRDRAIVERVTQTRG